MLRVHTEISGSRGTIRGTVHFGTSQQGDGPTTGYPVFAHVSFFYALQLHAPNLPAESAHIISPVTGLLVECGDTRVASFPSCSWPRTVDLRGTAVVHL